jgi:hypothetical protein
LRFFAFQRGGAVLAACIDKSLTMRGGAQFDLIEVRGVGVGGAALLPF